MVFLQASIGALNDLTDAPLDAGRKQGKPIPSGGASPADARTLVVLGLLAGLAASAPSGLATLAVAVLGVACGYAYDLWLSRTPWSWLPLAVALPLLPIHAWLGATGSLPAAIPALLPIGVLAGAGLALANGIADHERDVDAGTSTAVVRLGRTLAWRLHVVALFAAVALALLLAPGGLRTPTGWGIVAGAAIITAGALLARATAPAVRERGWEAEAVGVVVVGASWLAAVAGT